MNAKNHRKEEKSEAKTEDLRESLTPLPNGVRADITRKETTILPSDHRSVYIPKIENVVSDHNMREAIRAVKRNKGAPGIDGITIQEIDKVMQTKWPKIREQILEGTYRPSPVRRVEIPKPDGKGVRQLGIPTVMDRIIQQAVHQELVYAFEPLFSPYSYGFRPWRSAQQAVQQAHTYVQEGREWVVDIDLEKFFDKVNHDMLMARVARVVKDKKILRLIRSFLQAGVMDEGLVKPTEEGTPQGGPLSPLLSNILLNDLDHELEERGLRFIRYADDCNIYVKTERAGKRVMETTVRYLTEKLKLKVNEQKSAVDRPWKRKFLGYTFKEAKEPNRLAVHESRIKRLKDKIRGSTKKMRGNQIKESIRKTIMPITRGWANYFKLAQDNETFESLDGWIRRKIRGILWRQWKRPKTRYEKLKGYGLKEKLAMRTAYHGKGPWKMAKTRGMHKAISNGIIEEMGYIPMTMMVRAGTE
jgi:RNA-directed DNA polymerase